LANVANSWNWRDPLLALAFLGIAAAAAPAAAREDVTTSSLVKRWYEANGFCRGGSGDNPETLAWCEARDGLEAVLRARGMCFGKAGQASYQMKWHKCGKDSIR
jgi:hypothetical protein